MSGNHHPEYKTCVAEDGSAHVLIIHEDGREDTWVGFASESQVEAWITEEKAKQPPKKD